MDGLGDLFGEEEEGPQLAAFFEESSATAQAFAPATRLRGPSGFTGLRNQGATCYLNSLIQALYMTPEFRAMIYRLSPEELGLDADEESSDCDAGTAAEDDMPSAEDEALPPHAEAMVAELSAMGFGEQLAKRALIRSMQCSNASLERAIEWLFDPRNSNAAEELSAPPASSGGVKKKRKKRRVRKIPLELQKLFAELQLSQKYAVSTEQLTDSFGWKGRESYQQHDVHELNRLLFEAIEMSLRRTSGDGQISKLYQGSMASNVKCKGCGRVSQRKEHFEDVTVFVKDRNSIIDSLSDIFQSELLEGDNQYFCEACDCKQDAERWSAFSSLPPVLLFSLLRFEYSYDTGERTKNCSNFEYPLSVDLASLGWAPPGLPPEECVYDLFAVIIHTGTAGSHGHYHAYIKDLLQEGAWSNVHKELDASKELPVAAEAKEEEQGENVHQKAKGETKEEGREETLVPTLERETAESLQSPVPVDHLAQCQHCNVIDESQEGFFDFNDSSVEPITGKELRKQFGGKSECAYMLIYRKRTMSKNMERPHVPERLKETIGRANEQLKAKVAEEEMQFYKTDVVVYTPRQFYVDASGVARCVPDSDVPLLLSIDRRLSMEHLVNTILLMLDDGELDELGGDMFVEHISVLDELLVSKGSLSTNADSMEKAGIGQGMELMLWNGATLHGKAWDKDCKAARLTLDWLSVEIAHPDATVVSLLEEGLPVRKRKLTTELATLDPLHRLYQLVAAQVEAQPDDILLFSVSQGEALPLLDMDMSLHDLGIVSGSKISGEQRTNAYGDNSLVGATLDRCSETLALNVTSSLREDEQLYRVYASGNTTLAEVKTAILAREDCSDDMLATRLRHIERPGHDGRLFSSELRSLVGSGLRDESMLALERGLAPDSPYISISFSLAGVPDVRYSIDVAKDWTVQEAKAAMMSLAQVDPDCVFRLRKMDCWGSSMGLVTNELKLVRQSGFSSDCVLLLEPGDAPNGSQISVTVRLFEYRDFDASEALPSSACSLMQPVLPLPDEAVLCSDEAHCSDLKTTDTKADAALVDGEAHADVIATALAPDALSADTQLGALSADAALGQPLVESACAVVAKLPDDRASAILVSDETAVRGQEEDAMTAMAVAAAAADEEGQWETSADAWELYSPALADGSAAPRSFAVTTMGSIVVDQSKTLHELKQQLLDNFPLLAGLMPLQLRLWCKSRVLKHSDKSLSDQFVTNRSCLVLQALNDEEAFLQPDAGLVWLYVFRRNTERACFDRPKEYLFNQKQGGKPGRSLHSCLARDLAIPREHLSLSKYVPASEVWQPIGKERPPRRQAVGKQRGGRRWKKQKRCTFRDGDVLAYKDLREAPDAYLSHVTGLAPRSRPLLGGQRGHGAIRVTNTPSRRPEAQLRIFVDAFDDEEEEEEEDVDNEEESPVSG